MQFLKKYQGFGVDLFEISRLFALITNGIADRQSLLLDTGFGENKRRAFKEYLSDFDLLEKNDLTDLGQIVAKHDPRFREPFTRWLLLFHWSLKKNNPYLNFLVNNAIGISDEEKMIYKFKAWAAKNSIKTDYDGKMLTAMINNTNNALLESNAFLDLNFFLKLDGTMERAEPYQAEPLLLAYILYYNRRNRTSIGFSELLREENNMSKFFNLDQKKLDDKVVELNNLGLTRLIQYADLHHIEYTYNENPLKLVEKYYNEN